MEIGLILQGDKPTQIFAIGENGLVSIDSESTYEEPEAEAETPSRGESQQLLDGIAAEGVGRLDASESAGPISTQAKPPLSKTLSA